MADGDCGLGSVVELLEQAGRDTGAAVDYTRSAQDQLAEGQLLGIVANMDRILVKLDADHALIDSQRREIDSFRAAAAAIDDESVPQRIVEALSPVADGIRAALAGLDALDAELAGTQELTGEVLVGGAPHHIQSRIQRIRTTAAAARQRLESAATAVERTLQQASAAGTVADGAGGLPPADGVVAGLGFDPHAEPGALGDRFTAGVHEPPGSDRKTGHAPHEREAAAVMAREGADVRLCVEDHARYRQTSIDAWVRWHDQDPGTGTELKSVLNATNAGRAVKRDMLTAAKQLDGQIGHADGVARGQVLIDARTQQLTSEQTLESVRGAVGQANAHGQIMAARTLIAVDNDTVCVFEPRTVDDAGGRTVYAQPDAASFRTVRRDDPGWASVWRWA